MNEQIYLEQLIRSYELYQEESKENIESLFISLEKSNLKLANTWKDILRYWHFINKELTVEIVKKEENQMIIPKALQEIDPKKKLVITILGIKLNDDGSMNDELISRLEVGCLLANYFINAYIVVTGGPTAEFNPNVTEGSEMKKWLLEKGIDDARIIVEDKALDTVGNAIYTYQILKEHYPEIDSIILVSSDYHVARGSLLYYSTLALEAYQSQGKQLRIIANVGCQTSNKGYETIYLQAWSLCQVAAIDYWHLGFLLD